MSYAGTILADTPIRYYRLGDKGLTAVDLGSQAQNGTISGGVVSVSPLIVADSDTALSFDGTSGQIALPTTGLPTGANPWSIEAWVLTSIPLPASSSAIVAFGSNVANEVATLFFSTSSNGFKIDLFGGGSAAGPAATINSIYYLVGIFDGANLLFYQNGVRVGGPTAGTSNIVAGSAFIAQSITGLARWNDVVDEVAFYAYALSPAQINNHWVIGSSISPTIPGAISGPSISNQPLLRYGSQMGLVIGRRIAQPLGGFGLKGKHPFRRKLWQIW